ncbi:hypothetical protein EDB85DRAFT_1899571 [Lactarius pseudohatsudake]|nr:hypothetical protein EDB85DRAFT_1899571 [Lactarius pseudohatsudake]
MTPGSWKLAILAGKQLVGGDIWDKTSSKSTVVPVEPHLKDFKSSDRRKFRARTTERFQLAHEIADTLVPGGLLVQKFSAYNGEPDVCTLLWIARTRRGTKRAAVLILQVFYTSGDGDLLWFVQCAPNAAPGDPPPLLLSSPSWLAAQASWCQRKHSPVPSSASRSSYATPGGRPLAVGRMAIDADKIDNSGTIRARRSRNTWVDHLWTLGSKCGPPDVLPPVVAAAGVEATGVAGDDCDGTDSNGGHSGRDAPRPSAPQDPVENAPAVTQDGTGQVIIVKLTPEALQTSLAALPNSAFLMPTTTLYMVHILPARPFLRAATTPVDVKNSAFKLLSAFLHASEKGDLLKLKATWPDVQVSVAFPTHAAIIAYEPHRTFREEDERRRRAEEREAQQAAEAANAGKTATVTEWWKPHLGTLPLFENLGPDTAAPYPLADVKSALFTYAEKHDLVNRFEQQFTNTSSDVVFSAALHSSNAKGTFEVQRRPTGTDSFSLGHCNVREYIHEGKGIEKVLERE